MNESEAKPEEPQQTQEEILRNQILRLQADFENARKRWVKQQAEIQESANAQLLRELLDIYDDFLRAKQAGLSGPETPALVAGVEMITRRLEELLKSYGVGAMEVVGKPFDASRHEAVAHEATAEIPESTVMAELRKGYLMNGKVLRPAVVKVAVAQDTPKDKEG